MNSSIALKHYIIPLLGLMYCTFSIALHSWNIVLTGSRGYLSPNFPYPFTLVFLQSFICCIIFLLLNLMTHFICPLIKIGLHRKDSNFKIKAIGIDPFTGESIAFYGNDFKNMNHRRLNHYFTAGNPSRMSNISINTDLHCISNAYI